MAIKLGFDPEDLKLKLSRFGDFVGGLEYHDPDDPDAGWPDGAWLGIRFYASEDSYPHEVEWAATIDGKLASWHRVAADVSADVLEPRHDYARLFYSLPEIGFLEFAIGPVAERVRC